MRSAARRLAGCGVRPNASWRRLRWASSLPRGAAHPVDDAPPPVSESSSTTPPPPSGGLTCGGFFFTCDPNVGLWNDAVNPTWRLTFTDPASKEKTRVPYAVAIKNQGPHFEFALRLQFGHVSCDGHFADVPQSFNVDSGWEATFPAGPLWPVRVCQANISAGGVPATVSCVDVPIGVSLGFQRVVSGHGVKGISEASAWRSDGAMAAGGLAALYGVWQVATTPWTWMSLWEELEDAIDGSDARMIFEELDGDGKGFLDREDFRRFLSSQGDGQVGDGEADAIFNALNVSGTGRISFEEFEDALEQLSEAMESGELDRAQGGQQFGYPGASNGYGQAPPGQFVNQMRPFGGAFDGGRPGGGFPGQGGGFMGPGPVGPGPRPPSW